MIVAEVQVPLKKQQKTLRQIRLGLGMSMRELSAASKHIMGEQQYVHHNLIYRAENGITITELTATRILTTINALYDIRGRTRLTLDDITWNIRDRKQ